MSIIYSLYGQIAEILAQLEPKKLMALKASEEMEQRFSYLEEKYRNNSISIQEKDELDHFIVLERIIRLAKIKADEPENTTD